MTLRRGLRLLTFAIALATLGLIALLWPLSFVSATGFGLGTVQPGGWGAGGSLSTRALARCNIEFSLARGGLMIVVNGSRTDVIFYDPNMGCHIRGQNGFYTFGLNSASAPVVWLPSRTVPAPWAGTYILIPFWPLPIIPAAIAAFAWPRRSFKRGHCRACGYNRSGLSAGAVCPECGRPSA